MQLIYIILLLLMTILLCDRDIWLSYLNKGGEKMRHILECKRRNNEGILSKRLQDREGERKRWGEKMEKII